MKLVYTQLEAFDLVEEYTEAYKNKIKQLEEENEKLRKDLAETQKIGESRRQECKQLRKQMGIRFSDFAYGDGEDEQET